MKTKKTGIKMTDIEENTLTSDETTKIATKHEKTEGTVSNCTQLNIRKEPSETSEVIMVVSSHDKLMIELDESTDDWFKVCTAAGIEGFCMKKYVTV